MKILKKILIVLVILVAIAAIVGLMLPSAVHIERSMVVNAKPAKVYAYLDNMKKDPEWSPWLLKDTAAQLQYEGPETGIGSKLSWKSDNSDVGNGSMITVESVAGEKIKRELYFMEDPKPAYATFVMTPEGDGTKVSWMMDADMGGNPFMHIMGKMMSGMAGKEFEKGLVNLKTKVESMPEEASANFKIEMIVTAPAHYLAVHDTVSIPTIGEKLGQHFGTIQIALKKQNLNITGAPMAIYYSDSQTNWEMDAAIPVDKPGKADGKVMPGEMKGGNAVVAHYFGNYDKMGSVYAGLKEYLAANNLKMTGAPWEAYIASPMTEKDTAKWQTDVYFPVE